MLIEYTTTFNLFINATTKYREMCRYREFYDEITFSEINMFTPKYTFIQIFQ